MINKRLIGTVSESKKYIVGNVVCQWISLVANIVMMGNITVFLAKLYEKTAETKHFIITLIVAMVMVAVRYICTLMSSKMSYLSLKAVKNTLREMIYKKLLQLGTSYREQVKTSEVVQVAVEGVDQLETYFGAYLPQFFYAVLAPLTLFVVLCFVNVPCGVVLLICVPLIPLAIAAVQRWAKKLLSKYWGQYTALGDTFLENLQGLTTLKIYQADEFKQKEMNEESEKFRKITMKVLTMQLNSITIMDLIAYGGAALGVIMSVTQYRAGNVSISGCLFIILLSVDFFIPMRLLGSFFHIAMNGMAASFHPELGVVALTAYITVGVIIPLLISKLSGEDGIRFRTKSGNLSGFVLDSLRGLSDIIQYGQGERRLFLMNKQTDDLAFDEQRMKRTSGRNQAFTNTVILFFDLVMLFASAMLYQNGQLEFIGVLIPTISLMSSFGPVVALANLGSTLQNTFAAGNRVLDILDESPVVEEVNGMEDITFTGASAENVTFIYGEEVILDDVNVDIEKGSVVGIIGRSGSGKSTLLKLFMRFWRTREGSIKLSETDVNSINTANLRNMESFVTQETHLFHDSIKNNLRIAKLDATDEEIMAACKKASVHDFIMSLPHGYDTPVGELGDTLSGGERQRLGLARAFLHDSDMLLLDEPTSNLDSLNEAVILKSLKEEKENKTVVLVSHRKSTMCIAQKVYSVEHGRVS